MSRLVPIAAALVALTLVRAEPACSQSMDVSRPAGTEAGGGHVEAESGPTTPSAGPHRGPEPEAESDRHPNGRDQIGGSARGAAGPAQSAPEPPGAVSPLQNELQALYDAGKYAEAIPLAQQYLEESRSKFGDEHREVANAVTWLGGLYHMRGRYAEADPLMRQALAIREKVLGPDHTDVAQALNNLAQNESRQGRYEAAEKLLQRALAIDEKVSGPNHHRVGTTINNLALLYNKQRRHQDAVPLLERTIRIFETSLGPSHHDVAVALNNLATVYFDLGRYQQAEALLHRSLVIFRDTRSPDHPSRAITLASLAKVYEMQGRTQDAERLYRDALVAAERGLGPDHLEVARMRANLGGLLKATGRRTESRPLLEQALQSSEKHWGRDHPNNAYYLSQLGDLDRSEGRCESAEAQFGRARSIGSATLREIPIHFVTDRKRDASQPAVAFGGERAQTLSAGVAMVSVPQEAAGTGSVAWKASTEVRRLAMHCIELVDEQQLVRTANRRLETSQKYRNQALVFIHGYNVSFESSVRRAAQIAHDIEFDGAAFVFSWPARGRLMGYFTDRDTVDVASDHLRDFLERILSASHARKVHFIAHSMGNLVLLRALKELAANPSVRMTIGEVVNAAPDVDPDVFLKHVETIKARGGNFTLYTSQSDLALWLSSALRAFPRAGYFRGKPLIAASFDTLDVTQHGRSWFNLFALNHDIYASDPILVGDMQRLISVSERPPDKRSQHFEPVVVSEGTYWRMR